MTGFLIGAALALAFALLLLLRPFVWQRTRATASHRQLNTAIYRDQLIEIERDRRAGTLAEEDYRQAREELQRRVLEDGQADEAAPVLKAPRKTLVALALGLPVASIALYLLIGHPEGVSPRAGAQQQVSAQDIERMVATLAAKMEKEPGNVEGWIMLARSYKAMGRAAEAEKAYEHLMSIAGDNAQVLADYADLLVAKAGGKFAGKPQQLIDKALKLEPDNAEALWLGGTAAYEAGRYKDAVGLWSRLQRLLPPGSDDAKEIAAALAEAGVKAGLAAPKAAAASAAKAVTGRIELAAALRGRAAPDDTVMIVAREAGGPRMPIAVLRLAVADLPREFSLDDSLAMTPDRTISSVANIEVEARVSKSGQAMPQSGDLFSATQKAKPGKGGLRLVIDQVRP